MGVVNEDTCDTTMRTGLGLMTVFLGLATVAQLNDPDPLLWMVVYGAPGLITLCAFISINIMSTKIWRCTCFGVFIALLVFSSLLITSNLKNNLFTWNLLSTEEGRESAGLLIVLSWLVILLYSSSSQSQPRQGNCDKYVLLAFALVPLASWIGYKYFLQDIVDIPEHCQGVL